jgi:hypothetical protein
VAADFFNTIRRYRTFETQLWCVLRQHQATRQATAPIPMNLALADHF